MTSEKRIIHIARNRRKKKPTKLHSRTIQSIQVCISKPKVTKFSRPHQPGRSDPTPSSRQTEREISFELDLLHRKIIPNHRRIRRRGRGGDHLRDLRVQSLKIESVAAVVHAAGRQEEVVRLNRSGGGRESRGVVPRETILRHRGGGGEEVVAVRVRGGEGEGRRGILEPVVVAEAFRLHPEAGFQVLEEKQLVLLMGIGVELRPLAVVEAFLSERRGWVSRQAVVAAVGAAVGDVEQRVVVVGALNLLGGEAAVGVPVCAPVVAPVEFCRVK